ncbi:MAG: NIL domain-containing protein [Chthonomonadales bacterium]
MSVITVQLNSRTKAQVEEPIISKLAKDFDVTVNIRRAQVNEDYGFVEMDIKGDLEEAQRAVSWLHTTGLNVSAVQRSVGKDTVNL